MSTYFCNIDERVKLQVNHFIGWRIEVGGFLIQGGKGIDDYGHETHEKKHERGSGFKPTLAYGSDRNSFHLQKAERCDIHIYSQSVIFNFASAGFGY